MQSLLALQWCQARGSQSGSRRFPCICALPESCLEKPLSVGEARVTRLPGDSSCRSFRRILSSQLSLGMEFAVDRSAINDPDCNPTDPKTVSMASQEDSSQDCPKENSYSIS